MKHHIIPPESIYFIGTRYNNTKVAMLIFKRILINYLLIILPMQVKQ